MFAFVDAVGLHVVSQYLIIWSGNLPEEIPWYLRRMQGGWVAWRMALVVFHFALPFFLLLMRGIKREPAALVERSRSPSSACASSICSG